MSAALWKATATTDYYLMQLTDEEWLREARERVARGENWEAPPGAPVVMPTTLPPATLTALRCPWCAEPSALTVFPRFEVAAAQPLLYCPRCYGFWSAGDALAYGVADAFDEHPALYAHTAPVRCRSCGGRLDANDTCRACGGRLPLLTCPRCSKVMTRGKLRGITVDTCGRCQGMWFDVGEIALAFGLAPPQSLAMQTVDEHAADDEPPGWLYAAETMLRLFFQFL